MITSFEYKAKPPFKVIKFERVKGASSGRFGLETYPAEIEIEGVAVLTMEVLKNIETSYITARPTKIRMLPSNFMLEITEAFHTRIDELEGGTE